jgi:hypothetical protein
MMNESFSSLDRHAVLGGSDDGFPWFAGAMLAMESCEVVNLRLLKFAWSDEASEREASLMVSEKIFAAFEAGASWLAGRPPRRSSAATASMSPPTSSGCRRVN